ncbi:serine hydrolase [bacterium]|nr:serine hydrolase [bacterium]
MINVANGIFLSLVIAICVVVVFAIKKNKCAPRISEAPLSTIDDLNRFLNDQPYEIGFFAKNLRTGKTVGRFADRSVCLASIVKIFCLTELYRQKHDKALDINQKIEVPNHGSISLEKAADLMIGQSDNAATYALASFLGYENVNCIPLILNIDSLSKDILPKSEVFREVLDKRLLGKRIASEGLPQHGTAGAIAEYFELLIDKKVFSEVISTELINFFSRHPKPFSKHYIGQYSFAGKGGNLLWTHPPKHYSMMGWGLFLKKLPEDYIVLCVWGEWFPENMSPEKQSEFLKYVTDCVISIIEK